MDDGSSAQPYLGDTAQKPPGRLAMAMHEARSRLPTHRPGELARSEALASLPTGTIVAVFENRGDASSAAVQLLTSDPDTCLWLRSARDASTAIRKARSKRNLGVRLLRGFGDEELMVRQVLRQADDGRNVLVIRDRKASSRTVLGD